MVTSVEKIRYRNNKIIIRRIKKKGLKEMNFFLNQTERAFDNL